jgi:predicted PurR-regulated permease PerM
VRNPFAKETPGGAGSAQPQYVQFDPGAIESVFVAPKWLRDIGLTSWFAVGAAILLVATIGLFALTATITIPVILAAVVAAVASPVVRWLTNRGIPRGVATIIFVLALLAFVAFFAWAVMAGIVSQGNEASGELRHASDTITTWLSGHGIDPKSAKDAQSSLEKSTTEALSSLLNGLGSAIRGLSSLVFFLAMTLISLIFLLKDGPMIRSWAERHMGVPSEVATIVTGRLIGSLRGYFLGVTIIAIFNGLVVGIGAIALGVPLVATIVLVTFIGAYIPFLGAWVAGAFSVLIAFGADSQTAVVGMIIIQLLANGLLQQMVQPIAYGAALGIHPLAALIATIGGGCLFGTIGLILGAPMLSAVVRISADLGNARAADATVPVDRPPPQDPDGLLPAL